MQINELTTESRKIHIKCALLQLLSQRTVEDDKISALKGWDGFAGFVPLKPRFIDARDCLMGAIFKVTPKRSLMTSQSHQIQSRKTKNKNDIRQFQGILNIFA